MESWVLQQRARTQLSSELVLELTLLSTPISLLKIIALTFFQRTIMYEYTQTVLEKNDDSVKYGLVSFWY